MMDHSFCEIKMRPHLCFEFFFLQNIKNHNTSCGLYYFTYTHLKAMTKYCLQ